MTSQYLQIYDGILLEYEYTSILNPESHYVTDYKVEIIQDYANDIRYFFNTQENYLTTTNVRDYSAVKVADNKYAYLNIDLPLQFFISCLEQNESISGFVLILFEKQ